MSTSMNIATAMDAGWDWKQWRRPLLQLTCVLIGTMMFYRGLLNLTGYPGNLDRLALAPIFFGGVLGIYLMWRELRVGWWIFTALNFFVGYWFIFVLEDIWTHHVAPHIVFSAVFLPFYRGMKYSRWLARFKGRWLGKLADKLMGLLRVSWIVKAIVAVPPLHDWINKLVINKIVGQARFRPHPFSTLSPYASWRSLTEKEWSGRHLGVSKIDQAQLPDPERLTELFDRRDAKQRLCPKSTCLFPTFAQYLTDGFLRTVPEEIRARTLIGKIANATHRTTKSTCARFTAGQPNRPWRCGCGTTRPGTAGCFGIRS